jgi:hypothetical protein
MTTGRTDTYLVLTKLPTTTTEAMVVVATVVVVVVVVVGVIHPSFKTTTTTTATGSQSQGRQPIWCAEKGASRTNKVATRPLLSCRATSPQSRAAAQDAGRNNAANNNIIIKKCHPAPWPIHINHKRQPLPKPRARPRHLRLRRNQLHPV